ncbi:hypothetical protein E5Q_04249 [Mixia osmundae IAM 14324]|uniref:Uncharacterized protein n=1 Tax=Mixia osmundae (strain CBS 9802 / IAM 14324 / JCM 22182 / KY 12970) TaxID=764103 RepID=G7E411_MIXOS|nr:hypothetical protein E5Q_04249 [Mixia osmundae IAM 14324]
MSKKTTILPTCETREEALSGQVAGLETVPLRSIEDRWGPPQPTNSQARPVPTLPPIPSFQSVLLAGPAAPSPPAVISTELIAELNKASLSDAVLASVLKLAAAGQASESQLAGLARLISILGKRLEQARARPVSSTPVATSSPVSRAPSTLASTEPLSETKTSLTATAPLAGPSQPAAVPVPQPLLQPAPVQTSAPEPIKWSLLLEFKDASTDQFLVPPAFTYCVARLPHGDANDGLVTIEVFINADTCTQPTPSFVKPPDPLASPDQVKAPYAKAKTKAKNAQKAWKAKLELINVTRHTIDAIARAQATHDPAKETVQLVAAPRFYLRHRLRTDEHPPVTAETGNALVNLSKRKPTDSTPGVTKKPRTALPKPKPNAAVQPLAIGPARPTSTYSAPIGIPGNQALTATAEALPRPAISLDALASRQEARNQAPSTPNSPATPTASMQ